MTSSDLRAGCYSCEQQGATTPSPECIVATAHWRVAHAFNSTLEGWLVVLPHRHVRSLADLTAEEAGELGPLLWRASRALTDELGCEKTYVMQFSEAEGFSHLHFHVVPRAGDLAEDRRGARCFGFLSDSEAEWLDPVRTSDLAVRLARRMSTPED